MKGISAPTEMPFFIEEYRDRRSTSSPFREPFTRLKSIIHEEKVFSIKREPVLRVRGSYKNPSKGVQATLQGKSCESPFSLSKRLGTLDI